MIKRFFEIFNTKNWSWIQQDDIAYEAEFIVKGIKYRCRISNLRKTLDIWDLTFTKIDKDLNVIMTLTGDHTNSSRVFSNIIDIVEKFISIKQPSVIIWQSSTAERNNLYMMFGKHLVKFGYLFHYKYYENMNNILYYVTKYSQKKTDRYLNNIDGIFNKFK